MLDIGDTMPELSLPASSDKNVSLGASAGAMVLFFYPRDDTSGCTKEAIAFTGLGAEFDALGVTVYGVSKDSVKSHDKFVAKHDLGMVLLSDADTDLCERMGAWKEKSMYGKTFMGIERSTFLIDGSGKIVQAWRKVKVPGHAEAVLEAARAL